MAKKVNDRETSYQKLMNNIDTLTGSLKTKRDDLQVLLVRITAHAIDHGDVTLADHLIDRLTGTGIRRDAVVSWFLRHGPFRIEQVETTVGEKKVMVSKFKKSDDKFNLITAEIAKHGKAKVYTDMRNNPWDQAKKEADPFEGFNLTAKLQALLRQAERVENDEAKKGHPKNDLSLLAQVRALVPKKAA